MSHYRSKLTAILPPGDIDLDFDAINCELHGKEVDIVEDQEILRDVFEIGDNSGISFPMNTTTPMLALHLKSVGKFIEIVVKVTDNEGINRKITMSNNRSVIAADKKYAKLPLQIGEGWQYMCVDLADITKRCFGANHVVTYEVQLRGPSRLSKLYFQSRMFADIELPPYLRVIS